MNDLRGRGPRLGIAAANGARDGPAAEVGFVEQHDGIEHPHPFSAPLAMPA